MQLYGGFICSGATIIARLNSLSENLVLGLQTGATIGSATHLRWLLLIHGLSIVLLGLLGIAIVALELLLAAAATSIGTDCGRTTTRIEGLGLRLLLEHVVLVAEASEILIHILLLKDGWRRNLFPSCTKCIFLR